MLLAKALIAYCALAVLAGMVLGRILRGKA